MISPGSYRFRLENLTLRRSRITGGESQNFEMISPGSYRFRPEALGRLHR